tara:strand:- start:20 stop:520 length:501 start_codon:yes stop_codon:yes gene_type:complete
MTRIAESGTGNHQIYTDEQRSRRDSTVWTTVQGVLAPLQFFVFVISSILLLRYLYTGVGYEMATLSVLLKTAILYTIMVTGAIWEKVVFDQYLLAPSFFWEDVFSFFVIAAHTGYVVSLFTNLLQPQLLVYIALLAYFLYVINAAQFIYKFRIARSGSNKENQVLA